MKRKSDPPTDILSDTSSETPTDAPDAPMGSDMPDDIAVDPTDSPVPAEPPPSPPPPPQRQGIIAPLLGGALAAVAGFAVSHLDLLDLRRDTQPTPQIDLTALESQQAEGLAALRSDQAAMMAGLGARIDDLEQRLSTVAATPPPSPIDPALIDALDARLTAIETAPVGGLAIPAGLTARLAALEQQTAALAAAGAIPADLSAKVDAALADLAKAKAAAAESADEATAVAKTTRQRNAMQDLRALIDSGAPFDVQLAAVPDAGLQSSLAPLAATGVPTLASLQDSFPEAARAALRIARAADTSAGWGDRLVDFIAAQTEARSLAPREGTDPDAVLSRAEAAVRDGHLANALTELAGLDPAVAAPLTGWMAAATQRLEADAALDAAATRLPQMEE